MEEYIKYFKGEIDKSDRIPNITLKKISIIIRKLWSEY